MTNQREYYIQRGDLGKTSIDIEGRDVLVAFNEPAFRKSKKELEYSDIDAPLNARFLSYFLPTVDIARAQRKRPRLVVVSAIYAALKWNATSEREQKIMIMNNHIKKDFLRVAFERFFPDVFSLVEFRDSIDFLKIPEHKLKILWDIFEKKHPEKLREIKKNLARFRRPHLFVDDTHKEEIDQYLESNEEDLLHALNYAVLHVFATADINIGKDFSHNPKGYCSVGGHHERIFNTVRSVAYEIVKEVGAEVFGQDILSNDNIKVVVEDERPVPPAYNGALKSTGKKNVLDEVTYENERPLDYYDGRPRMKPIMEYLYGHIPRDDFRLFWEKYRGRYQDIRSRHVEAYQLEY